MTLLSIRVQLEVLELPKTSRLTFPRQTISAAVLPKVRTPLVLHYSQEVSNDPLGRGAACRPVAMEVLNCRFA